MITQEEIKKEKKRRIQVALWAYAYEIESDILVSDYVFDTVCLKIDLSIDTDNTEMDKWFREHFDPNTGLWIWKHPHLNRLKVIYDGIIEAQKEEEI